MENKIHHQAGRPPGRSDPASRWHHQGHRDPESDDSPFIRGDVNGNSIIDIRDPLHMREVLLGNAEISCDNSADFDDYGTLALTDVVQCLAYLFTGSEAPGAPGPGCGLDDTPAPVDCESSSGG